MKKKLIIVGLVLCCVWGVFCVNGQTKVIFVVGTEVDSSAYNNGWTAESGLESSMSSFMTSIFMDLMTYNGIKCQRKTFREYLNMIEPFDYDYVIFVRYAAVRSAGVLYADIYDAKTNYLIQVWQSSFENLKSRRKIMEQSDKYAELFVKEFMELEKNKE